MPDTGSATCVHDRNGLRYTGCAVVAVVAAMGLLLPALRAQETQAPQFRSGVDLVPVDVTVLDKNRKPVRGLTSADFTVYEDGKARPIVTFAPVELPPPARAPTLAAWTRDVPRDLVTNDTAHEGRLVIIVMDRTIRIDDVPTARRIAMRAVDELAPNDLASVVFTSQFSNAGKAMDFNNDHARLRAAIEQPFATAMVQGPTHVLVDPDNLESGDCMCGVCVIDAITRAADNVRDIGGRRKILFFIGTHVRVEAALALRGGNQAVSCTVPLRYARERMVRAAGLANVMLYSFDAAGVDGDRSVRSLADVVRGRFVIGTNAPETLVASVLDESSAYYLLGFERATSAADGRDHSIEVKVRRSGVTVYSRKGYVVPKSEPPPAARPFQTASLASEPAIAAITGVLPKTDLSLGVSVASFVADKDESLATVAVHVQRPAVAADSMAAPRSRRTEIVVSAFDRHGQSVAMARQTAELTGPASGAGVLRYEVLTHLNLKPGHYDLRVAATDATTGDTGSVHTTVDIPDLSDGRLSMSDLVITLPSATTGPVPDELAAILPVMPTPRRTFAAIDHPTVFARMYQGGKDPLVALPITVRILDSHDMPVLERAVTLDADRFGAMRSADYRLELPLASLPTGEYLLAIRAAIDTRTAQRNLRFVVK